MVSLFGVRIFFGVKVGRAVGDILGVDWKEAFTVLRVLRERWVSVEAIVVALRCEA